MNDHVTRPLPDPGHWVDRLLLQGPGPGICLRFGAPLDRTGLRIEVQRRQRQLHDAGLRPGGTAALRLPPSPALVTVLLAAWRTGAQVSLQSRAELVLPDRLTASSILDAVRAGPRPTTVIGVPFHAELLAAVADPPPTPMLERMIVAGEPVRPAVPAAFTARYGVPLGTMYGMTETGVIATDLDGALRPVHRPVHGTRLRVVDGELWIGASRSPYLGAGDPQRWSDGWLRTRDAAELDPDGGRLTVLGRRDSQVSIGGLKVDLTEVELALRAVSGVREAVVVFDRGAIEGYVALDEGTDAQRVRAELGIGFAAYKLPRRLRVLPVLPRTDTGKLLRAAADRHSPTR